jgi:hypothetical protein
MYSAHSSASASCVHTLEEQSAANKAGQRSAVRYHIRVGTTEGHGQCDLQRTVTVLIDSLQQGQVLRHSVTLRFAHTVSLDLLLFPLTSAHQPPVGQGLFIVDHTQAHLTR